MIKVLPKEVSDKIAAGEVIESPVSIIKELIENSIDAGANAITCEITKGGKEEIRITDNGSGIPSDQVETAFLRHATSKIETEDDLKNLFTLGFRGEALASVAAVSRTELITKTRDEKTGTRLIIHGGKVIDKESIGCPEGTTIIVRDLFYNVPARSKFMKTEAAEAGKVIDMMSRLSITKPEIRFTLISNGKNVFTTSGNGDLKAAIISVFKDREYKELVEVIYPDSDEADSSIRIKGYISRPSFTRTNRRSQYIFVNGRTIKNKSIDKGIDLGYKERLFEGRHPIVFLFLDMNPGEVDVNVHPNKKEVRFNDDIAVIAAVEDAIKNTITSKKSIIKASDTFNTDHTDKPRATASSNTYKASQSLNTTNATLSSYTSNNHSDTFIAKDDLQLDLKRYLSGIKRDEEEITISSQGIDEPGLKPFDFDDLVFGETYFGTYISATDDDNLYLFDQHAAHERVNYERFLSYYLSEDRKTQLLLTPFTLDIPVELTEEGDWLELLESLGYAAELFGDNTYIVREIPLFMTLGEAEDFAKSFLDSYLDERKTRNTIVVDKLISKACKASIKANDYIKPEEVKALIADLKTCKNPFSCPHGRPTVIKFSKYDLEKMFKRIV